MLVHDIFGFETGDASSVNAGAGAVVGDGTARSGDFHFRYQNPTGAGAGNATGFVATTPSVPITLGAAPGCCTVRGYLRFDDQYPTAGNVVILGFGTAANRHAGLTVNTSGQPQVWTPSGASGGLGPALPMGEWLEVIVRVNTGDDGFPSPYPMTVDVSVKGLVYTWGQSIVTTNADLTLHPVLFMGTGGVINLNAIVNIDDIVAIWGTDTDIVNVILPSASRILPVRPTAQGSFAAWTGTWEPVRKRPKGLSTTAQTTSTNDAKTTFDHPTADDLGLVATQLD